AAAVAVDRVGLIADLAARLVGVGRTACVLPVDARALADARIDGARRGAVPRLAAAPSRRRMSVSQASTQHAASPRPPARPVGGDAHLGWTPKPPSEKKDSSVQQFRPSGHPSLL